MTEPRPETPAPETPARTPRNLHYGAFYGLTDLPQDGRPLLLVHGNCQAESLRVLLELMAPYVCAVRLVPAHEMTADDVPHLHRLLERATYLVTQPIVAGYRGLPIGTTDLMAYSAAERTAVVPVLRWAGLHPTQVIVRSAAGDPPIVPYHDLRTVLEAVRSEGRDASSGILPQLPLSAARALRDLSRAELARRIEAHGAIDVVDLFERPGRRSVHVINHPTNDVLLDVAARLGEALGLDPIRDVDPGRVLLGSLVAPIEPSAAHLAELPLSDDDRAGVWRVHGEPVPHADIHAAHRAWYARHPDALEAALRRHRPALEILEAHG